MIKQLITVTILLSNFYSSAQDKKIIITDTISIDTLKIHNIIYEKCPGIMSGIPCFRNIQITNGKFFKKNVCSKGSDVYYKMTNEILVIELNDYRFNLYFKDFYIESNSSKMKLLSPVNQKKKIQSIEGIFLKAKVYVAKIKIDFLNDLLVNNIMVKQNDDYVNLYIIYGGDNK